MTAALPQIHTPIPGPRSKSLAERLSRVESPNITYLAPDFPVFWESAEDCIVRDVDGNSFLDMTAAFGVASVGHRHPKVAAAVRHQADLLLHGMGDVHPSEMKVAVCEAIARHVPITDAQVILGQNGGDAVEAALKTALLATGRPGVLAFEGGYHGLSYGALDATGTDRFRAPFVSQMGQFTTHLPYGCDLRLIDEKLASGQIGCVLAEPIQGRGGIIVPPDDWLAGLRLLCDGRQTLLILDEIFTGWGRTGHWFACERDTIEPDILCIGKAMGGGLPISACVASARIMAAWGKSTGEALHTSTFLGNPVACAAALAAIGVMEEQDLPGQAIESGRLLANGLRGLQNLHPASIHAVRGRGLMLGIEMASPELGLALVPRALARGLILLPASDGRVIEFTPPLTIHSDQISWALECLTDIFHEPD